MKQRPRWSRLFQVEFARCRLRPVLGRLPLIAAGIAVAAGAAGRPTGPLAATQISGAISSAATPCVLVAFAIAATVAHDHRVSGCDATDRSMVGRPVALGFAQAIGIGAWLTVVAVAVMVALALTLIVAAIATGPGLGTGSSPGSSAGSIGTTMARLGIAVCATSLVGWAATKLTGSAAAAIGGFLVLLLIGDGILLAVDPHLALAALPDNLLALASGQAEGLAVRGEEPEASAIRALIGTVAAATTAVLVDASRDLL